MPDISSIRNRESARVISGMVISFMQTWMEMAFMVTTMTRISRVILKHRSITLASMLREIARVLKPGGKVVILEFSTPRNPLFRRVYGLYSHRLLPAIGGMISKDRKAYEYLPASVDEFPAPECFMAMMREAGFKDCRARSQSLGIAQIYTGEK